MSFSNDNITWSAPQAYATGATWRLAGGPAGNRTVYVKYYDYFGNVSAPVSATIDLTVNVSNLTLIANPSMGGTMTGAGGYGTGETAHVVATPNAGYTFLAWTADSAGTIVLGTTAAFDYTMPDSDTTMYAQFQRPLLSVAANPSDGGFVTPGGRYDPGTAVPLSAIPSAGYDFKGWSSDLAGTTILSRSPQYTVTMPASDYAVYAQFVPRLAFSFIDGFESYNGSGVFTGATTDTSIGFLDSNCGTNIFYRLDSVHITPCQSNTAANGTGSNPWWGPTNYNSIIVSDYQYIAPGLSPTTHPGGFGNKVMTGGSGLQAGIHELRDSARMPGNSVSGNFSADWWFYDFCGQSNNLTTNQAFLEDAFSVTNFKNWTYNLDYPSAGAGVISLYRRQFQHQDLAWRGK